MCSAKLLLHGQAVSLKLMEDVKLSVEAYDSNGVCSTHAGEPIKLLELPDVATYNFSVPERCRKLSATLTGRVRLAAPGANAEVRCFLFGSFDDYQLF